MLDNGWERKEERGDEDEEHGDVLITMQELWMCYTRRLYHNFSLGLHGLQ